MRRYWSVILLAARGVTGKLLVLFAILTAVEAALVAGMGLGAEFLRFMLDSNLSLAFRGAILVLAAICCLWGSDLRGGRCQYTLGRLQVGEMATVVLWGLCYALAFLALMGFQLLLILGVCGWFAYANQGFSSAQTLFLAAHQDGLFHSLLPLEDWGIYVRNGLFALSLGLTCSAWSFWRRRNVPGMAVYGVTFLAVFFFPISTGSGPDGLVIGGLALAITVVALVFVWKEVRHGTD